MENTFADDLFESIANIIMVLGSRLHAPIVCQNQSVEVYM